MVSGKVDRENPTGLHLRPAGTLCKQAMQFKSSITIPLRRWKYSKCKERLKRPWRMRTMRKTKLSCSCEGEDEEKSAVPCQFHPDGTWGRTVRRKNQ